ncbi:MAG TPA: carotenoid biosynthesis protein [Blastocatellia bacterium]|nr:carotenoid biosynthesis protein [Blastocatellia bacterium]
MNWFKPEDKWGIRILALLYGFMLCGAIVSHVLWQQAPLGGRWSASFLFVAGVLALVTSKRPDRVRLLMIGLLGFIAEVLGVRYGWLFGRYTYTEVLAPSFLDTPIVMICAWFILIGYVKQLLLPLQYTPSIEACVGGAGMTIIDLLIDPIAAHPFDFWNWIDQGAYYGIPLHNFLGWFIISVILISFDQRLFKQQWQRNLWLQRIGLGIMLLYTCCAFGYGYWIAGGIGLGIIFTHGMLIVRGCKGWSLQTARENVVN